MHKQPLTQGVLPANLIINDRTHIAMTHQNLPSQQENSLTTSICDNNDVIGTANADVTMSAGRGANEVSKIAEQRLAK